MPQVIGELVSAAPEWRERIAAIRERTVFNVGSSGAAGAALILDTLSPGRTPALRAGEHR